MLVSVRDYYYYLFIFILCTEVYILSCYSGWSSESRVVKSGRKRNVPQRVQTYQKQLLPALHVLIKILQSFSIKLVKACHVTNFKQYIRKVFFFQTILYIDTQSICTTPKRNLNSFNKYLY